MIFEEKTLTTERIYEGAILNLRRDKVTVVGGGTSHREIVEHGGGAVVVPVTDEGKVVMVRQYRKAVDRVVLEVPAGKRDDGEDPLVTARRELKEETGYTADKIRPMAVMEPSVGYTTEALYLYLATGLTPGERELDEHEAIDVEEYPLEELVEMIMAGALRDGKTQVAVLMARNLLDREESLL